MAKLNFFRHSIEKSRESVKSNNNEATKKGEIRLFWIIISSGIYKNQNLSTASQSQASKWLNQQSLKEADEPILDPLMILQMIGLTKKLSFYINWGVIVLVKPKTITEYLLYSWNFSLQLLKVSVLAFLISMN